MEEKNKKMCTERKAHFYEIIPNELTDDDILTKRCFKCKTKYIVGIPKFMLKMSSVERENHIQKLNTNVYKLWKKYQKDLPPV